MYKRAKETDSQCLDLVSDIPSAKDLAAIIGVAKESVVIALQVAGFLGGPEMMDGKIGDGMLVITELNGRKRLHFLMHEMSASIQSNEYYKENLNDKAETFPNGGSITTHFYDMRARYAYKSEHRIEGGYMVDGTYVEFLGSRAEWQDTGKVSKLFTGSQFENTREVIEGRMEEKKVDAPAAPPPPPPPLQEVEEVEYEYTGGCCGCGKKKRPKKKPEAAPPPPPKPIPAPQKEKAKPPVGQYAKKENVSDKGDNVSNEDEITPTLERYLTKYAEAIQEVRGFHPTQYTDSVDGKMATATLLKKLHTVNLVYDVFDEVAKSEEPQRRMMTVVCDPFKSPFEDIIKFTTNIQVRSRRPSSYAAHSCRCRWAVVWPALTCACSVRPIIPISPICTCMPLVPLACSPLSSTSSTRRRRRRRPRKSRQRRMRSRLTRRRGRESTPRSREWSSKSR